MVARNIGMEIFVACLVIYVALTRLAEANIESDALIALRESLTDPNEALKSWDPSLVNPCTWFHITCNQDNQVTRVDLIKYDLSGNLVPDLGNLQNLQYLELQGNKIQGTIPPELGNLKNLISLDLYDNALTGNIPPSLGNLNSLIFLRLQNNQLTGRVPDEIKRLHLKVLDVSGNPGLTPSSANM